MRIKRLFNKWGSVSQVFFLLVDRESLKSTDCNWLRRFWFSSSKRSYSRRNPSDCLLRATALASDVFTSFDLTSSSYCSCLSFSRSVDTSASKVLVSSTFPSSKLRFCFFTASMLFLRIRSSLM
ncbi:hypothetical protein OIU77_022076 [Salix suchowensis]|uniref:Uncharacterized protein n=2 Tax=Salix TaxID=40685 RepID=A0A9Q0WI64_SALPP|nr:hypothetical protein OIU77_022076 [Salix suchowensis]KAJ6767394.1 hypothetical protein OIU79_023206 [Salix purpurea]